MTQFPRRRARRRFLPPFSRRGAWWRLAAVCCFLALAGGGVAAGQDPAAARLLREAERLLAGGDPAAALEELQLLTQQFPRDRLAPRALLQIAELHRARGNRPAAKNTLERLLGEHARSGEAATAMTLKAVFAVADARSSGDLEEARTDFRRVPLLYGREAYPELLARRRALIESGELGLVLGDPASAAADFVAAIEDEPPSPAVGRARLGLGRAWMAAGNYPAALEVLERLASAGESATSDAASRERAGRLLSLYHRRILRRLRGRPAWTAGRFSAPGLQLRESTAVAVAEDGRLVVVDPRLPLVAVVDGGGNVLAKSSLRDAERPFWTRAGVPFVATPTHLAPLLGGESQSFLDPRRGAALKGYLAAAAGTFGDFFVVAKGVKGLLHLAADGGGRELYADSHGEIVDVARDEVGQIYALDGREAAVVRFDRDGGAQTIVARGDWKRAGAVAVDALGFVYVLDRGNRRVDLYDPGGTRLASIGPALGGGLELRSPSDLAVDGSGRVFLTDEKLPFLVVLD